MSKCLHPPEDSCWRCDGSRETELLAAVERHARAIVHPNAVHKTSDPQHRLTWIKDELIEQLQRSLAELDEWRTSPQTGLEK